MLKNSSLNKYVRKSENFVIELKGFHVNTKL